MSDKIVGCVTWFDSKKGYGFVKVLTPNHENNGSDIFIHFSNIIVNDREYKVVYPGEYIEFNIVNNEDGKPCCSNVTGLYGGNLLTQNPFHRYKLLRKRIQENNDDAPTDAPADEDGKDC